MDEQYEQENRPVNPRRKKRSRIQEFKERYLPLIITGVAFFFVLVFIGGSISRTVQKKQADRDASIAASEAAEAQKKAWDTEAENILRSAAAKAASYDYEGAIALIDGFSGTLSDYPELQTRRSEFVSAQSAMVAWDDPSAVTNLSFQLLVADPARAFTDATYADSFQNNFVTIGEFSNILQQLYDNNYMLVSLDDIVTTSTDAAGQTVYVAKTFYLPSGKKPLMLTQTNVNYNLYMVDGDGDGIADKDGSGFASRLVVDGSGDIKAEMVDSTGTNIMGNYDLVPILEEFISTHPDFALGDARAVLAVTGYNGVFGYRTQDATAANYKTELDGAMNIVNALRAKGYIIACYTYDNMDYDSADISDVKADLQKWKDQVEPILGSVDVFAFAKESEFGSYSGEKFEALMNAGFRYYLGFNFQDTVITIGGSYFRMPRTLVDGYNLMYNGSYFSDLFDAESAQGYARDIG